MGFMNREIERKFVVKGVTQMQAVRNYMDRTYPDPEEIIIGKSKDVYFNPPNDSKADFARVRFSHDSKKGQLTLKSSDKGNNVDRIEIDVEVEDADQAVEFCKILINTEPSGIIDKRYIVYILDKKDTTVSLYQIVGDQRIFLEIEARALDKVDKVLAEIKKDLPYALESLDKSLFQIFVEKVG
ncbi:MAG: CYTH domain-containing protein [Candidatus Omnitrophica bacterium]|nr:CYTH domain-containing protein [Candidatus Omnitrophota bacterium]